MTSHLLSVGLSLRLSFPSRGDAGRAARPVSHRGAGGGVGWVRGPKRVEHPDTSTCVLYVDFLLSVFRPKLIILGVYLSKES
jgi:hypothetical protein